MKWASALSDARNESRPQLADCLSSAVKQVQQQLGNETPDLAICFVSPHFSEQYDQIPEFIRTNLGAKHFAGCSGAGLIGGGTEIEHEPAVALTAAVLPNVQIKLSHFVNADLPDLDDGPHKWEELVGATATDDPHFILLPDPFSFDIDTFVQGLDFAFPKASKIGGIASGARRAGQNAIFIDDKLYRNGMVCATVFGDIIVETIVAQGCRPIGRPLRVSKSDKNFLYELDGQNAVEVLHDIIVHLNKTDQALARESLYLGIAMSEFKSDLNAGDFIIRNILGIDATSGALVVAEPLRNEQTIQFHVRDAETSADDLRNLLRQYTESHGQMAHGALLFSCLGRGTHLYGTENHDSNCFKEFLGPVPLGGFFCNGEIGPVGGTTFLHGYTSSFGLFRNKP